MRRCCIGSKSSKYCIRQYHSVVADNSEFVLSFKPGGDRALASDLEGLNGLTCIENLLLGSY